MFRLPHCPHPHTGLLRKGFLVQPLLGNGSGQLGRGHRAHFCSVFPWALQLRIEVVQVLGADVNQFQMPNAPIDAGEQLPVFIQGAGLDARSLFLGQDVFRIALERLLVVQLEPLQDRLFKGHGHPVQLPLDLCRGHAGGGRPGFPVSDLFPGAVQTVRHGDAIGSHFTVFVFSGFNQCHSIHLPVKFVEMPKSILDKNWVWCYYNRNIETMKAANERFHALVGVSVPGQQRLTKQRDQCSARDQRPQRPESSMFNK